VSEGMGRVRATFPFSPKGRVRGEGRGGVYYWRSGEYIKNSLK